MTTKTARFEIRWTIEQRELFERASLLGGFKTLSEFVFQSVYQSASDIIENQNKILKSEKDKEIFFDALINPPASNQRLKKAVKRYNKFVD